MITHFETFINSYARVDPRSRELDGDFVLCPPSEDYGYHATPRNALTFAAMGVDGVHFAILKIEGTVDDDCPIVQVSPMDSDDVILLAPSLLDYLKTGCEVSAAEMQSLFDRERSEANQLVPFLNDRFHRSRLFDDNRIDDLMNQYGHLIERREP